MPVSLDKRIDAAAAALQAMADASPVDLGDVSAAISLEVDFSYSMTERYRHRGDEPSLVQEIVDRSLALSLTGLDDDGVVPVSFFDDQVYKQIDATRGNYDGLVENFLRSHTMGGTNYAGPIKRARGYGKKKLFGKKSETPNLHLLVTDGAPSDKEQAERELIAARESDHFWQIIMVGTDPKGIAYVDYLNNELQGPGIDNVGVTYYANLGTVTDEQFFQDVVSEFFPIWLPAARAAGYTK